MIKCVLVLKCTLDFSKVEGGQRGNFGGRGEFLCFITNVMSLSHNKVLLKQKRTLGARFLESDTMNISHSMINSRSIGLDTLNM